jgi:CubicO group peptidase (beta-lactamase class C family)
LLLEERGKLKADDPIKKYMTDAPAAWDKITIFNLLTHTSGIPSFTEFPDYSTTEATPTTPEKLVARFHDKPLSFMPGEKWAYSNSGYVLLGYLLEKISGQSYRDFVQENIFKPLEMNDSGYDSNSAIIPRRASGYSPSRNGTVNTGYIEMTIPFSAGGLYSTTEDLLRWEEGLFRGKVLSAASLRKMTTAFKNDYAFGLAVRVVNGHALIEHGGGIEGFNTQMSYYPDDKLTVIVLGNLNGSAPGEIATKLARFCVPALTPKPIADTEPQVTTLVRTTLADLAANKPNLESFDPTSRPIWAPERIKGLSAFVKSLGALKSIDLLERKEDNGSRLYTYRAEFADHTMLVNLTLDRDDKITAFRVHPE